jgi:RNA polymerase sigma-70 factor (sigma-E family)
MWTREPELSFEDFVRARSSSLLRTALLLASQNRAEAEDLLQVTLERAYRHWARVCRSDDPDRYVRRILVNASADRWHRIARRAEQAMPADLPDPSVPDQTGVIAERDFLLRALAALAPGQRAVLVLPYFDDLSEGETARMLGCSVGTVKSQAARALDRLRRIGAAESGPGPPAKGLAPANVLTGGRIHG